jgi:hypothetical protein
MHVFSSSIIKSSAYRRQLNFVPFGNKKGSKLQLSNSRASSFMYRLKRSALNMHPCHTPFEYGKESCF